MRIARTEVRTHYNKNKTYALFTGVTLPTHEEQGDAFSDARPNPCGDFTSTALERMDARWALQQQINLNLISNSLTSDPLFRQYYP